MRKRTLLVLRLANEGGEYDESVDVKSSRSKRCRRLRRSTTCPGIGLTLARAAHVIYYRERVGPEVGSRYLEPKIYLNNRSPLWLYFGGISHFDSPGELKCE